MTLIATNKVLCPSCKHQFIAIPEERQSYIKRTECRLQAVLAELDKYREALEFYDEFVEYIIEFNKAYPLDVFSIPDFGKARKLLAVGGITIDSISAANMRHVLTRMMEFLDKPEGKRAREALTPEE